MLFFKNLKIRTKVLITALAIGFIPVIIVGSFALIKSREALLNQALNQLESVRQIKKTQLEAYFSERKADMHVLVDMLANFKQKAFQKTQTAHNHKKAQVEWYFHVLLENASLLSQNELIADTLASFHVDVHQTDSHAHEKQADEQHGEQFAHKLAQTKEKHGLLDVFLIAKDGHIVYTAKQGAELGQNLLTGVLKESSLNKAFQKGLNQVSLQDFAPYGNKQQVAFVVAPIFQHDKLIGVLAFSLLPDALNAIVQKNEGLGETGGFYLVGEVNGQTYYRSNRITKGKEALIGDKKSGADIDKALAGQSGIATKTGSTGDLEIGAYSPLQIPSVNWGIITTVQWEEAIAPQRLGERENFFAKYIREYDYYDLFLIHPQGKIFDTVLHEADYGTNIIDGKYADSGLGELVRKVLQTKKFGMSDYAPYAPSNDEPAAFIALPLLHEGKIELVVAAQLSDKEIDRIMQQRAGMGETGESYLVGSDYLMRSNSFLDPVQHSIIASFANPSQGAVKTDATYAVFSGETGSKIIRDYRGLPVLSAYTPMKMGETTWAVIAEIDKAEAFQPITTLQWLLAMIAIVVGFFTWLFINTFTKRLTTPLLQVNERLGILAQGKLVDDEIKYQAKDEIGDLVISTRKLTNGIKNTITQTEAIATGDYSKKVKLLSEHDQLGHALSDMTHTLRETTSKNAAQDWLKTGQAQLSEMMSGEQDIVALAKKIFAPLTTAVDGQVGLFYMLKNSSYLQIIATYAYTANDHLPQKFKVGDGFVGQAVLEKKKFSHTHTPEEYTQIIESGLATVVPRHVFILPFLYENNVTGVIEIGFSNQTPTSLQQDFLQQAMPSIGIAVNTAESRTKMQVLLEKTQKQAEELSVQKSELESKQQELQQSNEELQAQSEELQTQSEELQTQQEELRQINEELEERTKELEQQQQNIHQKNIALEETKVEMEKAKAAIEMKAQELELASQYKSEFLANMSHELRTPLNSLLILSQVLTENQQGNLNDKQIEFAQTIHSAGSDLLALINEILDLSKVEAGKIDIHLEEVPLVELVKMIQQKFNPIAENKGINFHVTLANNLPTVLQTDKQRLKQIINNLLSNAFKFTSEGEVKMTIEHPANSDDIALIGLSTAQTIALSVTDSGIGIPKDKQQVIFEAFQQADGSTSRRYGGTGLGLSISRQLARMLGGDLVVHSEPGKGSTFTLYIVDKLESVTSAPSETETPASTTEIENAIEDDRAHLTTKDQSILIIEDDRKFSRIIVDLARESHFKCLVAEDGKTGLQLAEQYKPNAIILDVGLPELDGWTVMERLKDNPETRHIPVHFMSGYDQSLDAQKMGAIGYLHKPVNMQELGAAFKKIEQFIDKTAKNLLVVVDNKAHQQQIVDLVGSGDVQTTLVETITAALEHLKKGSFDCLILDVDVEQGFNLFEELYKEEKPAQLPVIIYTDRELTDSEETLLQRFTETHTIKTVKSQERLLDETTLFLHQVEAKLPQEKQQMLRMVHDKETILKGKKVLVVDDDVRNIFAVMTVLEGKNMDVVVGNNGKEALSLLEEESDIALVLMDIMMPEMDGYEAMRQIRAQPRHRQLPIIALTAKAMKGDRTKCIEAGANDYISKPLDTEKLLSLMRVWLYR